MFWEWKKVTEVENYQLGNMVAYAPANGRRAKSRGINLNQDFAKSGCYGPDAVGKGAVVG